MTEGGAGMTEGGAGMTEGGAGMTEGGSVERAMPGYSAPVQESSIQTRTPTNAAPMVSWKRISSSVGPRLGMTRSIPSDACLISANGATSA